MTLATQWMTLSVMFASGALLGIFLDVYRVISRRFSMRGWSLSLIDLLFWVASACFVFGVLLWSNWGEMRFYIMIAIITGIFVYLRLLTKPVSRLLTKLLQLIEKTIHMIIRAFVVLFYRPLVLIITFIWRMIRTVLLFIWKIIAKVVLWVLSPVRMICRPYTTKLQHWWASRKKGNDDESE